MIFRLLISAPFVLALAACTVGPDYQPPVIGLEPTLAEGGSTPIGDVAAHRWWLAFNDPLLNDLIGTGLEQNLDIQTSIARVAEAQAGVRATGIPAQVAGSISANATRSGGSDVSASDAQSVSFAPSVMLDLFGGERRSRERALAQLQAAQLDVGTARLTFVAALVSSYIDLRYYQEAMAITRATIANRTETLSLVQNQRDAGTATDLDQARTQAALDEAIASLPSLESGFYSSAYAIATLVGQPVQTIEDRLERGSAQPIPPSGSFQVGVPADLLRNRPDIRSAERNYAAAVAAVGVREADLYPSLSLGGTVSASEATTWSFGPTLSLPVLNQGVLRANRDQSIAQAQQAELAWRGTVLEAVEETQSAQTNVLRNRRAVFATRDSVQSFERLVDLSQRTFEAGTTDLIDLLESQRSLASANMSLASANRELAASWASLQIAAGKGWLIRMDLSDS